MKRYLLPENGFLVSLNHPCLRPWGFTMIKAGELTHPAIIAAMEKGDMYASQGPLIEELYIEDGKAHIAFSEAKAVAMKTDLRIADVRCAEAGQFLHEAVFDIPAGISAIRFTVADAFGRYADTKFYGLT